jgi:hypothetical protein
MIWRSKKVKHHYGDEQLSLSHIRAFALWTREAVQSLIKNLYGLEMPITNGGAYLQRWGFTPQKPVKRAYYIPIFIIY